MIDEKKLIEDLKKHFDALYKEDGTLLQSDHICISEDVEDLIKFIEQQPKTDWIPCEEMLPSEYDEYIVTYKEISNEKVKYYTSTAWFKPQTKRWYGNISIPNLEREVIAWQEKPTPYERITERKEKCSYEVQLPRSKQYICKKTGLNCTAEKLKFCKYKQPYKKEGAENEM